MMHSTAVLGKQDHASLAKLWGDLIEWPRRLEKEGPFLTKHLNFHRCQRVFDTCLGDGIDSIFLLKEGYSVTSNELDKSFVQQALKNASLSGVALDLTEYDWRDLEKYIPDQSFDALLCLGNSLAYLFDPEERRCVLQNFAALLKPGGLLIIDERNYPFMLANRKKILRGGLSVASKRAVYCGEKVDVKPVRIEDDLVIMHYHHKELDQKGYLSFYPFKKNELQKSLQEHFADARIFSDYIEGYNADADFYQHICIKN